MEEKINIPEIGNIKISEEVVAILADKAVKEVEGIAGLSGSLADNIAVAFGKKSATKGIGVDIKEGEAIVHLHVIVRYGYRIPEIAWQAQEVVKNTVESMTGLVVTKVNVSVEGVQFPDEAVPQQEEEAPAEETVTPEVIEVVEEEE